MWAHLCVFAPDSGHAEGSLGETTDLLTAEGEGRVSLLLGRTKALSKNGRKY